MPSEGNMEVFAIPVENRFILYRPLRRLAFVGNGAMARLIVSLAGKDVRRLQAGVNAGREPSGLELGQVIEGSSESPDGACSAVDLPAPVLDYLKSIGFLEPDPPPPTSRDPEYRPTNAVLLSTNRCNLRCIYCYANAGTERAQDVSIELAKTAIDHVCQNAVEVGRSKFELTFHGGGEPTLAWTMLEGAVAHARAKDLPCHTSMVSNGIWTERQGDWIIDNLDRVTISLDGTQETQDRQRPLISGKGTFQAVMRAIDLLDRYGFDYGIRMTALAPWRDQLARDVQFVCEETGCRSIQVEPAFNVDRGEYQPPSLQECEDFVAGFMDAFEIVEKAGRRLHFSGARPLTLTSSFCSAPYGGLIVTPSGDLVTCYEVTSPQHPLAQMCTIGRIEDGHIVVDEGKRSAVLSCLASRRQACRDCFCYWHCAGDCHIKSLYPGVDLDPETNTRCRMNRAVTAQMLLWYIAAAEDGVYRGHKVKDQVLEE